MNSNNNYLDKEGLEVILNKINNIININNFLSIPIGAIMAFFLEEAPNGWLVCDGSTVETEDFPELVNIPGVTDNLDGTITIPDLRNEFLRGKNNVRAIGHKQAATQIPFSYTHNNVLVVTRLGSTAVTVKDHDNTTEVLNTLHGSISVPNHPGITDFLHHTIRPQNAAVLFCIKYASVSVTYNNDTPDTTLSPPPPLS